MDNSWFSPAFDNFFIECINNGPAYIWEWVGRVLGGVGGGKSYNKKARWHNGRVRVAVTSTCTHKGHFSSTRPRQTCTDSESFIRSPLPNRSPPLVPFHQLSIYMVGKKELWKEDQSTLASVGTEHAYVNSYSCTSNKC